MKTRFYVLIIFFIAISAVAGAQGKIEFDKRAFYKAISSESLDLVDRQLKALKKYAIPERLGFEGALLMKKAGLVFSPAEKLSLFRTGHKKLESAIKKDSKNTEFRFLRLIIQENAPAILNYKGDIDSDSIYIKKTYAHLPESIQKVIEEYSKTSEVLQFAGS